MKPMEQQDTNEPAPRFDTPKLFENGTIRRLTGGDPEEILDENGGDFWCIERAVRVRPRQ